MKFGDIYTSTGWDDIILLVLDIAEDNVDDGEKVLVIHNPGISSFWKQGRVTWAQRRLFESRTPLNER